MKGFVLSLIFAFVLAVLFVVGMFANAAFPAISAFCLWSPAMIAIGWTGRGIGKRLVLVDVADEPQQQQRPATAIVGGERLKRLRKEDAI